MSATNLYERLGEENLKTLVETSYEKIRDDYRVSRFFNDTELNEQISTLKIFVKQALNQEDFKQALSDFFMSAFARFKDKERLPESGFAYFGYIISQNNPSQKWLCDSHSHLLKFMPDDSHYDAVMEHLKTSLDTLNLDDSLKTDILRLAESGRDGLLGK